MALLYQFDKRPADKAVYFESIFKAHTVGTDQEIVEAHAAGQTRLYSASHKAGVKALSYAHCALPSSDNKVRNVLILGVDPGQTCRITQTLIAQIDRRRK